MPVNLKTRKESYIESDRFDIEFYKEIGLKIRDVSRKRDLIVPFSNIAEFHLSYEE